MANFEWSDFEKIVGNELPKCIKVFLSTCGYDSMLSLKHLTNERIDEMEQFIERKRPEIMAKLPDDDDAVIVYKKQNLFEFLPGHRSIISNIPNIIKDMQSQLKCVTNAVVEKDFENNDEQTKYSVILSELIKTAEMNKNKSKHANQYNDIIRYFSTYIFLLCGRTCYETLYKNLPIPSTKTICE